MTLTIPEVDEPGAPVPPAPRRASRRARRRSSLFANGEPMVWVTGGALVLCLVMIAGLLAMCVVFGLGTFWPQPLVEYELVDGERIMGEVSREESYAPNALQREGFAEGSTATVADGTVQRRLVRTGNFELTNEHFRWISDPEIVATSLPAWALVIERMEWGRFYGTPEAFRIDGEVVAQEPEAVWELYGEHHDDARERVERIAALEKHDIGRVNARQRDARLAVREAQLEDGRASEAFRAAQAEYEAVQESAGAEYEVIRGRIAELRAENDRYVLVMETAGGRAAELGLGEIVRAYPANALGAWGRLEVYASRWLEFLTGEPREANSEGGVWPAIFGTVLMTLIMSIAVVPFGVLAALYLREYARQGRLVSIVRVAVNNLAGVPSIVFGVFGLGFFCYVMGWRVDQLFYRADLPNPTFGKGGIVWASLTLALLTLPVVIVATEEALAAVPNSMRQGSYACGATKWQTIQRIVLPRSLPGIMTGMILAISRGAGEVAPLMLVGAVKLAPELPFDGTFPYFHGSRSFMHLGFHIYDLGFQSQNSEAAKPMVFTTTLLLIGIIVALNVVAIVVRGRLRRRFTSTHI